MRQSVIKTWDNVRNSICPRLLLRSVAAAIGFLDGRGMNFALADAKNI